MARTIRLAKQAGFCFGVKRAVDIAMEESAGSKDVVMLGDIVHNEHVVQKIDKAGVRVEKELNSVDSGTLLLRAHGTAPEIYREADEKSLNVVDATCPLVLDIHTVVRQYANEGYRVVIIGDHGHDEVVGIAGQVEDAIVVSSPEDVKKQINSRYKKIGVVLQSTQTIENAQACVAELIPFARELKYHDTICGPTKSNQREIRKMPNENDVMIIVGSFTSANTCRMTELSRIRNERTYQVESADDLQESWFDGAELVGIHAGASTPDWIIKAVAEAICNYDAPEAASSSKTQDRATP